MPLATALPSPTQIRAELDDLVQRDLLGPAGGADEEIADGNPQDRYLMGMLSPAFQALPAGEIDSLADDSDGSQKTAPQMIPHCPPIRCFLRRSAFRARWTGVPRPSSERPVGPICAVFLPWIEERRVRLVSKLRGLLRPPVVTDSGNVERLEISKSARSRGRFARRPSTA